MIEQKKGYFFTFEGGEGSGKTTIRQLLEQYLAERKISFITTREPGGTNCPLAEQLRNLILMNEMDPKTESILYTAARSSHLRTTIIPSLKEGKIVISDRFVDSSYVYQKYTKGVDGVIELNEFALEEDGHLYYPDATLYFDVSPETGLSRIASNNRETNRFDKESIDFHLKVREGYLDLASRFPERFHIIDASKSIEEVFEQVLAVLKPYIKP